MRGGKGDEKEGSEGVMSGRGGGGITELRGRFTVFFNTEKNNLSGAPP